MERIEIDSRSSQCRRKPLYHHGLQYTASGCGDKIPTEYMVQVGKRWYRVYAWCWGNSGTLYIIQRGQQVPIDLW